MTDKYRIDRLENIQSLQKKRIDELEKTLNRLLINTIKSIPAQASDVVNICAEIYDIPPSLIYSSSQTMDVVSARYMVCYALTKYCGFNQSEVGRILNHRHPSTISHSVAMFRNWLKFPEAYKSEIAKFEQLKNRLNEVAN